MGGSYQAENTPIKFQLKTPISYFLVKIQEKGKKKKKGVNRKHLEIVGIDNAKKIYISGVQPFLILDLSILLFRRSNPLKF